MAGSSVQMSGSRSAIHGSPQGLRFCNGYVGVYLFFYYRNNALLKVSRGTSLNDEMLISCDR